VAIREKAGNLGSLLSVFILSFTVVTVLAIGILSAYGCVIGILQTFASQPSQRSDQKPVLAPSQARAAHAGGD
jgi:nitrate reductase NapE component